MRFRTPAILALLALVSVPCFADELLRFKSGYEMMVVSHREAKGMIIVTLEGGGEVGFPKDSLELLEGGKPTQRTGPSPLYNKIPSRVHVGNFIAKPDNLPSRFLAKGASSAEGVTVGYSKGGAPQQRFSGGPIGNVASNGRIGFDIRDRGRNRKTGDPAIDNTGDKNPRIKTFEAIDTTQGD